MSSRPSPKRFVELLQKSRLISDTELREALERYREKAGGDPIADLDYLIESLISDELLTEWQADKICEEKYKGFFLDKYKLLGHLGTGGMSSVYLGEHIALKQQRAIKVLPRKKVEDKTYLERFYIEARAIASLNHPNIVRAHDIDHEGKTHFIVMEYVNGKELSQIVEAEGPMDYKRAARYIAEAADALQHAHSVGLVHRDVKPSNLLINEKDVMKVLDLGLALFKEEDYSLTVAYNEKILGTADYLAPEQARNSHEVDHRADVYGLGCSLYFILTGHPPFPEGTLAERILCHQKTEPADIRKDRPDCPVELLQICKAMMVKDRDKRIQTCRQVAASLRAWLDGKPIPVFQSHKPGGASANQGQTQQSDNFYSSINSALAEEPNATTPNKSNPNSNPKAAPSKSDAISDLAVVGLLDEGDKPPAKNKLFGGQDIREKYRKPPSDQESVKSSMDDTNPKMQAPAKSSGSSQVITSISSINSPSQISFKGELSDLVDSSKSNPKVSTELEPDLISQQTFQYWMIGTAVVSSLVTALVLIAIYFMFG